MPEMSVAEGEGFVPSNRSPINTLRAFPIAQIARNLKTRVLGGDKQVGLARPKVFRGESCGTHGAYTSVLTSSEPLSSSGVDNQMEEGSTGNSNSAAETLEVITSAAEWLDLGIGARLQASSEDPSAPVADAFAPESVAGWRAAVPGAQTIDVIFDLPRDISCIRLVFERPRSCTHEFTLSWSDAQGERRELVRQQFNFHEGAMREFEEYRMQLQQARGLHVLITPDITGGPSRASLRQCRIR